MGLSLADPLVEDLVGDPELEGARPLALPRGLPKLNGVGSELRRILRPRPRSDLLRTAIPLSDVHRTGQLQRETVDNNGLATDEPLNC